MKKIRIVLILILVLALLAPAALAEPAGVPIAKITVAPGAQSVINVGAGVFLPDLIQVEPAGASTDKLVFTSSNDSVANVTASRQLVGNAPGKVTVTVKDPAGKATAKMNLQVIQPITAIQLTPDPSMTVFTGKKEKIGLTIQPADATNKKVVWSANDESIAKVTSNGTVTGVNPGRTFIHCNATDGSNAIGTIIVDVVRPLKKITFASKSNTLLKYNDMYLTYNTEPVDATDSSLDWFSSDESVAYVSSTGCISGRKPGKVTITAIARDGSGVKASTTVYVEPDIDNAFDVDYLWWELNRYGLKTGRIKVDVVNRCINRRIKYLSFRVDCYDQNGGLMGTTFPAVITNVAPGKRVTTKYFPYYINGLDNATKRVVVKTDAVTFDDGTMVVFPYGEEKVLDVNVR